MRGHRRRRSESPGWSLLLAFLTLAVMLAGSLVLAKRASSADANRAADAQQASFARLLAGSIPVTPASLTAASRRPPGAAAALVASVHAADPTALSVYTVNSHGVITAITPGVRYPQLKSAALAAGSPLLATSKSVQVLESSVRLPSAAYLVGVYPATSLRAAVAKLQNSLGVKATIADRAGTALSYPAKTNRKATPIGATGWTVTVGLPATTSYGQLRNTLLAIAAALAALLLAASIVSARASRQRRVLEADAERAFAASEQRFHAAFVHAPIGIIRLSQRQRLLEVNVAFCQMLNRRAEDLIGCDVATISHPDDDEASEQMMLRLHESGDRSATVEKRFIAASGAEIWCMVSAVKLDDLSGEPYVMAQVVNISERKVAEVELNQQAMHDALTGLPNRLLLESRIDHALSRLTRDALTNLAVMFIDLDGFKEVNDRLGHQLGDEVLREIADRLRNAVRPGDTVARLGGDEFVVLCEALPGDGADGASYVSGRILRMVNERGGSADASWQVSASIGISRPLGFPDTSAALINRADAAMYRAKQQGKNRVEIYDASMAHSNSAAQRSLSLVESALSEDRLKLHYQPLYDLRTRTIVGAESLVRMVDREGKLLAPADFLASAEAHGQIVDFGAWSLLQACLNAVAWKKQLPVDQEFSIAVNMSVKEIEDSGFLRRVDYALAESGLSPQSLAIELTESAFLRDIPSGRSALEGLRERGVKLSLDDFGTGFSSLSYLRRFPVDTIKLDRSFVNDLQSEPGGARVTRGLIALAHTLETLLVAEGVEDETQVGALLSLGSNLAQGYLLSRPLDATTFSQLLKSGLVVEDLPAR